MKGLHHIAEKCTRGKTAQKKRSFEPGPKGGKRRQKTRGEQSDWRKTYKKGKYGHEDRPGETQNIPKKEKGQS